MKTIQDIISEEQIDRELDKVISVINKVEKNKDNIIKTASSSVDNIDKYITDDNLKSSVTVNDIIVEAKSEESGNDLEEQRLTIISKEIKDPHYEANITKVKMKKGGKNIYVVSYFLRETYLGRYLINRNFYFLEKNHKRAKKLYSDLAEKTEEVRNEYYGTENFTSIKIPIQLQNYTIDQTGDFNFENEKSLGTTVQRKHVNESSVYEWFRENQRNIEKQRNFIEEEMYDSEGGEDDD